VDNQVPSVKPASYMILQITCGPSQGLVAVHVVCLFAEITFRENPMNNDYSFCPYCDAKMGNFTQLEVDCLNEDKIISKTI